jgi:hypothetical protein
LGERRDIGPGCEYLLDLIAEGAKPVRARGVAELAALSTNPILAPRTGGAGVVEPTEGGPASCALTALLLLLLLIVVVVVVVMVMIEVRMGKGAPSPLGSLPAR